jgi:hypothetical protein
MQKIHEAAKDNRGNLDRPEEIGLTSLRYSYASNGKDIAGDTIALPEGAIILPYDKPLAGAIALATAKGPREYLLGLIAPESRGMELKRMRASSEFKQGSYLSHDWNFAEASYQRWVAAYGEQAVLAVAEKVRKAQKRLSDGAVFDYQALGASHRKPYSVFLDLLCPSNPKGYARAILSFHDFPGRYEFGKIIPPPASIDASYQKLVSNYGEEAVLTAAKNFSQIDHANRSLQADPALDDGYEAFIEVVGGKAKPKPAEPVIQLVDNPQYLGSRGFSPGAKVTHLFSIWDQLKSQKFPSYPGAQTTRVLQSIDKESASLTGSGMFILKDSTKPPRDESGSETAKIRLDSSKLRERENSAYFNPSKITSRGSETLLIDGHAVPCNWVTTSGRAAGEWITVWSSDEVPGGLVRCLEHSGDGSGNDHYTENLLLSFSGTREQPFAKSPPQEMKSSGLLDITSPLCNKPLHEGTASITDHPMQPEVKGTPQPSAPRGSPSP